MKIFSYLTEFSYATALRRRYYKNYYEESEHDLSQRPPHEIFMDIIAKNPQHQGRENLNYLDSRCEEIIKDCEVLFLKDHIERKRNSIVSEDKTHTIFRQPYSLETLSQALEPIIGQKDPSLMLLVYFKDQVEENPKRKEYFIQKGLSDDEATACALALSFYTGYAGYGTHTAFRTNRGTSLVARTCNLDLKSLNSENYYPIMQYMIKALAYIPYYWGPCIRYVDMTAEEQEHYQTGSIVSWVQFTSSTKTRVRAKTKGPEKTTDSGVSYFSNRNTVFHIYSLSGRCIQPFSNFPEEEEVLFAPWCTFLITKKKLKKDGKTHIFMRQVELGITQDTILWVDDKILNQKWKAKNCMEDLTSQGLQRNLRIIPKTSTKLALDFIDSKFGQHILRYDPQDFQIITDMRRPGEENGSEAGAILIKELRQRGFNHKFTVFAKSEANVHEALTKHAGNLLEGFSNYAVHTERARLLEFVSFRPSALTSSLYRETAGVSDYAIIIPE